VATQSTSAKAPLGKLGVGDRVRLLSPSHALRLHSDTGVIARPAEWDNYFIVKLDQPAEYLRAEGQAELLDEVREDGDNLVRLS
jgi:hypothetical protein